MKLRMPAEWEGQEAIWLAWPHNKEDWPDKFEPIPWVYAEIIRYITQVERVRLVVKNTRQQEQASSILERAGVNLDKVDFIIAPTDRVWLRDSGPTIVYAIPDCHPGAGRDPVRRGSDAKKELDASLRWHDRVLLDWHFNAWAKYDNWHHDDKIPKCVETFLKLPRIQPVYKNKRVVLEGGSIDVNGKGTLITTEECLLSRIQCRNPGLTRAGYEEVFAEYLGVSNVIWLENGIVGDDTHGHVDDIARFVNATTIVTVTEKDKRDSNHALLQKNLKRLKATQFTIAELPMPKPLIFEGQRLPASYANFLIAGGLVLVPTFNDSNDRVALNVLAELFPGHDVVGIYCGDFVWGLGTIHCASQQEIA